MITMKNLQVEDIKDEWLYNALTQGIKECITAPVLTLDPTKPEPIKRAEMILENFSQEDSPSSSYSDCSRQFHTDDITET